MKLNHINLTVDDIPAARDFLQTYFGMRRLGEGRRNLAVLTDDDLVLTLMGNNGRTPVAYPKTFHVGFVQPTDAAVAEINQRLHDDGFDVPPPSGTRGNFYVDAPGGFKLEVLCLAGLVGSSPEREATEEVHTS